jgi:preprotein translocase subunit SecE
MAEKKVRLKKTAETVRERADKVTSKEVKPASRKLPKVNRPLSVLRRKTKKTTVSRSKTTEKKRRFKLIPRFFPEAWTELKLVTWPTKKEAARLTGAVLIFATFFAIFVQLLDFVFNKLVKEIFLK